jgi:CPA1 family monovalent cation:H+ antiporter
VLAAVTTALWLGWRTPTIVRDAETRLQIRTIWTNVLFVINVVLFLLVGLQLHGIIDRLDGISPGRLIAWAVAVTATVMVTRMIWVFFNTYVRHLFPRVRRTEGGPPPWQHVTLVGWIGMRGSVSLAAALALPAVVDTGAAFPHRDLLVFLTFAVILGTLLVQGMTLPALVRALDIEDDDHDVRSEAFARMEAARAVSDYLAERHEEDPERAGTVERMRALHDYRDRRYEARYLQLEDAESYDERLRHFVDLSQTVHQVQRDTILRLRNEGQITDLVMGRVLRDIDLEDLRLRE